jgi:alkanesulfonate monooxygenase SsuD/methylene tetrahydromethanopterin reductase-like flavin-dependent oxidoreductase (luciferase family)
MIADVQGQAQAYLQKTVEQALQKFLTPNLAALQSVLGAGLEAQINSLKGQIADLITNNPVVQAVDDLKDELAALTASGGAADIVAKGTAALQKQVGALAAGNPVVGTVQALRAQLDAIVSQAGPGLNFLAPQQRLVQGKTRSMRFGG